EPLPDFKGEVVLLSKGFSTEDLQPLGVPKLKVPQAELRFKGSFQGGDLKIESLLARLPPAVKVEGRGAVLKALSEKPQMQGEVALELDTPDLKVAELVKPADLPPQLRAQAEAALKKLPAGLVLPAIKLRGRLALDGDKAVISPTEVATKYGKITLSGTIRQPLGPKPDLDASAELDLSLPDLKAADLPAALAASLPKGLDLPAAKIAGRAAFKGERLDLAKFKVQTKFGSVSADGSVNKLLSKAPEPDLQVSLALPETKVSDLPVKLSTAVPADLVIPAVDAGVRVTLAANRLKVEDGRCDVKLKGKTLKATLSGVITDIKSKKPAGSVALKVDFPPLTTSDLPIPVQGLPRGVPIPVSRFEGKFKVEGDDLLFENGVLGTPGGEVKVRLTMRKLLAGAVNPDFDIAAKPLKIPAFQSASIPLPNVPQGLDIPATEWDIHLQGTPDVLRPSFIGVASGANSVKLSFLTRDVVKLHLLEPAKMDWRQWVFFAKLKTTLSLKELSKMSPALKDMRLSGLFATPSEDGIQIKGTVAEPELNGKVKFAALGISLFGLDISDFKGDMDCSQKEIGLRQVKGQVGGDAFTMDYFLLRDYLTDNPKSLVKAEFKRLDLAKVLEAKKRFREWKASLRAAAPSQTVKSTAPVSGQLDLSSDLVIRKLVHPNLNLNDIVLKTDLENITPDFKAVKGKAELYVGIPIKITGQESSVDSCATSPGSVKDLIAFMRSEPALQGLAGTVATVNNMAALIPGMSGINDMEFKFVDIVASFTQGVMEVPPGKEGYIYVCSDKTGIVMNGSVDLAKQTLPKLTVGGSAGKLGMTVIATGPLASPKLDKSLGAIGCPADHRYCNR
ncbi:MAG: hypothetical protein PHU21_09050, partial [Elusimicrobia bacterium]|nr:hypothetical protein [Elusimicrobiota bacterium]